MMSLSNWLRLTSCLGCALLPACSAVNDSAQGTDGDVGSASTNIVNGSKVATCAFPSTVHISMGCTGTLVHPQLVTTAAHCLEDEEGKSFTIELGDNEHTIKHEVKAQRCKANPNYNGSTGSDFAFCVLEEPIADVPIAPVIMGCETSILEVGQEVVLAGFGMIGENDDNDGSKRAAFTEIAEIGKRDVTIGSDGKSACYGDSGGPAFVKLKDGSWRSFGITSGGSLCGEPSSYALIHPAVGWIEQESGIDITPCHTADGTWSPSDECRGFSTNLDSSTGTWNGWCRESATFSAPSATCGDPIGSGGAGGSGGSGGGSGAAGASGSAGASSSAGASGAGAAGASGSAGVSGAAGASGSAGASGGGSSSGGSTAVGGVAGLGQGGSIGGAGSSSLPASGTKYGADQDAACSCSLPGSKRAHRQGLGLTLLALALLRFRKRSKR